MNIFSINRLIALEFLLSKSSKFPSLTENLNFIPFTVNYHTFHLRFIVALWYIQLSGHLTSGGSDEIKKEDKISQILYERRKNVSNLF